jgi:hypothetical protein
MMKPSQKKTLLAPLYHDDYCYVEENAPPYFEAIGKLVAEGVTPQQIYITYMQQSPNRQAFWLRCRNAAEYMTRLRETDTT